jgi:hypothetical protein
MHRISSRVRRVFVGGLVVVACAVAAVAYTPRNADAMVMPRWILSFYTWVESGGQGSGIGGGGGLVVVGSGMYYATVDGVYRPVTWVDYQDPTGGIIRECGIANAAAQQSQLVPCP